MVQEKTGTKYEGGLVFLGGYIEEGESLRDSIIREIKKETGLTISNPQPCGFKDWIQEDGTRYIVILYKANEYTGEIKSSEVRKENTYGYFVYKKCWYRLCRKSI